MIVISRDLALSQSYRGANNPVVGYDNLVTIDTVEADGEEADFPISNVANPATNLVWLSDDDESQYVTVIVPELTPVDYVGIARHNFGSDQIVISIEGYSELDEGDPQWVELVEETLLRDDAPAIFRFEEQLLFGVRVKLQPPEGVFPTMAVLYVGKLLVMPRSIYVGHTPLNYGVNATVTNARSENGNFLGRVVLQESRSTGVSLVNLPRGWYRENMVPFTEAAIETPFFFAWRPREYPSEVGYAWLTADPHPVNSRPEGFIEVELSLGGITV